MGVVFFYYMVDKVVVFFLFVGWCFGVKWDNW